MRQHYAGRVRLVVRAPDHADHLVPLLLLLLVEFVGVGLRPGRGCPVHRFAAHQDKSFVMVAHPPQELMVRVSRRRRLRVDTGRGRVTHGGVAATRACSGGEHEREGHDENATELKKSEHRSSAWVAGSEVDSAGHQADFIAHKAYRPILSP
jgi:hypothetical protein